MGCGSSEKIAGKYYQSWFPFGGAEFVLKKDSTFTYYSNHCTGRDFGSGHYVVRNDSLIFMYGEAKLKINNPVLRSNIMGKTANDTAQVSIHVFDYESHEDIPVAIVLIKSEKDSIIKTGGQTDLYGNVSLKIPVSIFPVQVEIRQFGYTKHNFILTKPANYKLESGLFFSIATNVIASGKEIGYKIISRNKDSIKLDNVYLCDYDTLCHSTVVLKKVKH